MSEEEEGKINEIEELRVRKMFVPFAMKDGAKLSGCRWDSRKLCWYMSSARYDIYQDHLNEFRVYALVDNTDNKEIKKKLNCTWNPEYKKWTVSKHEFDFDPLAYANANIRILTEIIVYYTYQSPPRKSDEEQLAELMRIMQGTE